MEEDNELFVFLPSISTAFISSFLSLSLFCNSDQLPSAISRLKLAFMIMSAVFAVKFISADSFSSFSPILPKPSPIGTALSSKFYLCSHPICRDSRKFLTLVSSKSSEAEEQLSAPEDEWLKKLPEKKKPLYSHSLPSIEAWLRSLGFYQSKEDRAVWFAEKVEWHAQLSLDITDLYIRYLKNGPGNLEKDVERRFSYALSREDIENAVLGGP